MSAKPEPHRDPDADLPRGLVLFRPGTPARFRRRRLTFLALLLLAAAAVIWPVYPRFATTFPLVLGLPLSLAWVVLALAVTFAALIWLYLGEERP